MTSSARHRYSSTASSNTYSPTRRKVSSIAETSTCWSYNPENMSRDSFTENGHYNDEDFDETNSLSSYDVLNVYKYSLDGSSPSRSVSIVGGARESVVANVPPPVLEEEEEEEEQLPAASASSCSFDTKWAPKLAVSPSTREMKMKDFNML